MNYDPVQKVNDGPWPQGNPQFGKETRVVAIVILGLFGAWLLTTFLPFLFDIPLFLRSGYFFKLFFNSSGYWLSYFCLFLGGIYLLQNKKQGYVFANGACLFFLLIRAVHLLYFTFRYGIGSVSIFSTITGLSFPLNFYSLNSFVFIIGIIYIIVQLNRSNIQYELGNSEQDKRKGYLLAAGLVAYSTFTMLFAELLFPIDTLSYEF